VATRKRQALKPDSNGRYPRNLGWKLNEQTGKYVQHKFYLGTDQKQAERREQRLLELWEHIEKNHSGDDDRPTWNALTLRIARALANGEVQIVVERQANSPESYARYIHRLARSYPMVSFVPEESQSYEDGRSANLAMVQSQFDAIDNQRNTLEKKHVLGGNITAVPLGTKSGPTLHQALDAYIEWIKSEKRHAYMNTRVGQAERLKERHADAPLDSLLTYDACDQMVGLWRRRPPVKGSDKPIAVVTAQNHIYELKCFFRWLHRSERFPWRKPEDFDLIDTRVPELPHEKQAKATTEQVQTFTLAELCILNEYATPLERLLLLLGLNCGFGGAESGTLTYREVFLHQIHPKAEELGFESTPQDSFIRRVRLKSNVYGEHLLWPQTVTALQWAVNRRQRLGKMAADSPLLVSDRGEPLFHETKGGNYSKRIQNLWQSGLLRRVRMDYPDFRKLSFGKLRKTAGNLIKRFSDGETAGVFLCHGIPVKSDVLSDVYTNRDFAKVFAAIRKVQEHLQPMFDAAPGNLTKQPSNQRMGRRIVSRMHELQSAGLEEKAIAQQLNVAVSTVRRHLRNNT